MLVRTILLPSVLKANPENPPAHYGMVIRLLQDLEKNGVVLLDDTNCIRASLRQDIPKWPVKFRKKAEVLLTALKKKNRFVEVSLKDEVQATCKNKPCQQGIRIAKIYSPPAIMASTAWRKFAYHLTGGGLRSSSQLARKREWTEVHLAYSSSTATKFKRSGT